VVNTGGFQCGFLFLTLAQRCEFGVNSCAECGNFCAVLGDFLQAHGTLAIRLVGFLHALSFARMGSHCTYFLHSILVDIQRRVTSLPAFPTWLLRPFASISHLSCSKSNIVALNTFYQLKMLVQRKGVGSCTFRRMRRTTQINCLY
jgi:hypothetical protein